MDESPGEERRPDAQWPHLGGERVRAPVGDAAGHGRDGGRARRNDSGAASGGDSGGDVSLGGPDPDVGGPSRAELQDRWRRAVAELDNQRKRYERQLDQVRRTERDRVTAAWLPVLDHLELALQHVAADPAAIVAGVEAVHRQALSVLAGLGYRRLDEAGARFDPNVHKAAQVVADADAEPNTVLAVLRPGYAADTRLLRPAVVTVAGGQE